MKIRKKQGTSVSVKKPPHEVTHAALRGHNAEQMWIVGHLLTGQMHLFGKRVRIEWPDGLPDDYDEARLHRVAMVCLRDGHSAQEHLRNVGSPMFDCTVEESVELPMAAQPAREKAEE